MAFFRYVKIWDKIIAEYHRQSAFVIDKHCQLYHVIEISFCSQVQRSRHWNKNCSFDKLKRKNINIIPAKKIRHVSRKKENECLSIYLQPAYLAEIALKIVGSDSIEIKPKFAICDPAIYHLALLFKSELESNKNSDRLYIDSLTDTLISHLLRRYSTQILPEEYANGLAKNQLREIVEYIEDHLTEDLSLQELAQVLHLNPHYFTSLFKQSMGMSAYQYVIVRRVETAKQLLQQQHLPIIDIAHCAGFKSSSHFSNTFRQHTGVTPSAYRKLIKLSK